MHHVEIYVTHLEQSIKFWTPFLRELCYEAERWSEGINYFASDADPYLCFLEVSDEHKDAGYHRKRVGLNHLAFRAKSREQVDELRAWVKEAGYSLLYDEQFPFATAPNYYAMFCEDPDRIKVELVAPSEL